MKHFLSEYAGFLLFIWSVPLLAIGVLWWHLSSIEETPVRVPNPCVKACGERRQIWVGEDPNRCYCMPVRYPSASEGGPSVPKGVQI